MSTLPPPTRLPIHAATISIVNLGPLGTVEAITKDPAHGEFSVSVRYRGLHDRKGRTTTRVFDIPTTNPFPSLVEVMTAFASMTSEPVVVAAPPVVKASPSMLAAMTMPASIKPVEFVNPVVGFPEFDAVTGHSFCDKCAHNAITAATYAQATGSRGGTVVDGEHSAKVSRVRCNQDRPDCCCPVCLEARTVVPTVQEKP